MRQLLAGLGLPVAPPNDMDCARFAELMRLDKKVIDGRLRLVLMRAIGDACVVDDVAPDELEALFA